MTISPRYSQANGRVENSVKTAKRLMLKASEAGVDPFLSLLEWRNTPSSQLHSSPVEILFGRRTRTRLPIANSQLSSRSAPDAANALAVAKQKQAKYYDRTALATERPTLPMGQTVRFKHDNDWRKAEVSKVLPNRSYELTLEDGTTRRRSSRHIRPSKENFTRLDDDGDVTATPPSRPPAKPPSSNLPQHRPNHVPYKTRSGRTVKLPARFND